MIEVIFARLFAQAFAMRSVNRFTVGAAHDGLMNSWTSWICPMPIASAKTLITSSGSAKRLTNGLVFTESENPMCAPVPYCIAASIFVDFEAYLKNIAAQAKKFKRVKTGFGTPAHGTAVRRGSGLCGARRVAAFRWWQNARRSGGNSRRSQYQSAPSHRQGAQRRSDPGLRRRTHRRL